MGSRKVNLDVLLAPSPLDVCLGIWARWNALADHQVSHGVANEQDVKEFMRVGEAVDSKVNAMARVHWWAIYRSRGICTAWIFKETVFADALAEAEKILEEKLRKHDDTKKYFN